MGLVFFVFQAWIFGVTQSISLYFSFVENLEGASTHDLHQTWLFFLRSLILKRGTKEYNENFQLIEHLQKENFPVRMTSVNGVRGFLKSEFFVDIETCIVFNRVIVAYFAEILGFV
jgi:hypothetical protein